MPQVGGLVQSQLTGGVGAPNTTGDHHPESIPAIELKMSSTPAVSGDCVKDGTDPDKCSDNLVALAKGPTPVRHPRCSLAGESLAAASLCEEAGLRTTVSANNC